MTNHILRTSLGVATTIRMLTLGLRAVCWLEGSWNIQDLSPALVKAATDISLRLVEPGETVFNQARGRAGRGGHFSHYLEVQG